MTSPFPERIARALACNKAVVYVTNRAVMTPKGRPYRKKIFHEDYINYRRASLRAMRESAGSLGHMTPTTLSPRLRTKTLVIAGEKDTMITAAASEQFARTLSAQYVAIEHGGHLFPLEDPGYAGTLLRQFLDGAPVADRHCSPGPLSSTGMAGSPPYHSPGAVMNWATVMAAARALCAAAVSPAASARSP